MGRIFSGLVGSSEENLRRAIRVAESVAPVVLWIDEIEKGLSGIQSSGFSDGGVTARVFGTLLTWLQEKTAPVFVVATANRIEQLPPELLRKGRFDEIFFIDLPALEERREIFEIHVRRRGRDPAAYDLAALARRTAGFSRRRDRAGGRVGAVRRVRRGQGARAGPPRPSRGRGAAALDDHARGDRSAAGVGAGEDALGLRRDARPDPAARGPLSMSRLGRFLRIERARAERPAEVAEPSAETVERFGNVERASRPAAHPPASGAELERFGPEPPPRIELLETDARERPFTRCMRCGMDHHVFATECTGCGASLDTGAQRDFNERLWAKRQDEAAREAQAAAERKALQEHAEAEAGAARLAMGEALAREVGRRERLRLRMDERRDGFGGIGSRSLGDLLAWLRDLLGGRRER